MRFKAQICLDGSTDSGLASISQYMTRLIK